MKQKYYLFIYDRYGWCERGIFEDIESARKYINKMKDTKKILLIKGSEIKELQNE